jgi:hypothetical protein
MTVHLVGIMYHEPESFARWERGLIEDYESSTGLFIEADSPEAAVAWGEHVGEELLWRANSDATLDWKRFGYFCWLESMPSESNGQHCLDFFQHVKVGQMPELDEMTTEAYSRWLSQRR